MRRRRFGKNASSDITRVQQCLRDIEIAVINRDGEKLLMAAEQLEILIQLLDDGTDITDEVLPYLGMKAACKEIMVLLDALSKHGEHLVHLLKKARDSRIGYDRRMPETSILQGLDVSG